MNNGHMTGAIFIDLSKAFDTLSHAQIIVNLSNYGILGTERDLFVNYLFNCKQSVRICQEISPAENVTLVYPRDPL
jgi:hypothetical protein